MPVLGTGGFGKVYKYTSGFGPILAIKEETNVRQWSIRDGYYQVCYNLQRPLITGSTELFEKIVNLKHPRVIQMLEYVVGKNLDWYY